MSYSIATLNEVKEKIWNLVHETPVIDIQTRLYAPDFNQELLRTGIDELLTSQDLTDELFRYYPQSLSDPTKLLTKKEYTALPVRLQAEVIWHRLFLANTPISESTRSVLTALGLLGLDPKSRNLGVFRNHFKNIKKEEHINTILKRANIESIICCYDPFENEIAKHFSNNKSPAGFFAALDLTEIAINWKNCYQKLINYGIQVKRTLDKNVYPQIINFLAELIKDTAATYLHLELPANLSLAGKSSNLQKLMHKCIIPVLLAEKKPLSIAFSAESKPPALNTLKINQPLHFDNCSYIRGLTLKFPELKIIITDKNPENYNSYTRLAAGNRNLMPLTDSSALTSQEAFRTIIGQHLQQLGTSFIAHTSKAYVYEQLLSSWAHSRWIIAEVLQEKYSNLYRTGWRITSQELEREIFNLFNNNAREFLSL